MSSKCSVKPGREISQKAVNLFMKTGQGSSVILGTAAEDNFAELEKISYPILNIEKVFVPHDHSANGLVPHPEVFVHIT